MRRIIAPLSCYDRPGQGVTLIGRRQARDAWKLMLRQKPDQSGTVRVPDFVFAHDVIHALELRSRGEDRNPGKSVHCHAAATDGHTESDVCRIESSTSRDQELSRSCVLAPTKDMLALGRRLQETNRLAIPLLATRFRVLPHDHRVRLRRDIGTRKDACALAGRQVWLSV